MKKLKVSFPIAVIGLLIVLIGSIASAIKANLIVSDLIVWVGVGIFILSFVPPLVKEKNSIASLIGWFIFVVGIIDIFMSIGAIVLKMS